MTNTLLSKLWTTCKGLLFYTPSPEPKPFTLSEPNAQEDPPPPPPQNAAEELDSLLRYAHRVETALEQAKSVLRQDPSLQKTAPLKARAAILENQRAELSPILLSYTAGEQLIQRPISASVEENQIILQKLFGLPENQDIVLREFALPTEPSRTALLAFTKGLIDPKTITSAILTPLLGLKQSLPASGDFLAQLMTQHLTTDLVAKARDFRSVVHALSDGDSALFVDGIAEALLIETKGFEHRAVSAPQVEQTVRGSQVAFTETLRTNLSLIRLSLRARDLITEMCTIGARSQLDCAILYIHSIANPALVAEVKRRIQSIRTDYLAPGTLEQFICDHPFIPIPQVLSTERPDRVSAHLAEGRVAILAEGDPFALVVPISVFTLFHSPEDYALSPPAGTFMRILRITAAILAILLPSLYIAICYYHTEALPTDLILAIAGARERIPFPSIIEVLIMEFSLEFVREAGTRIPGMLGETLGIVGGIILGQAVVSANLISSIAVVVIALTAIASFAIPDFRTGMSVREFRFLFLLAAMMLGLVGVASLLFLLTILFCSMRSFGVPFLAPLSPRTLPGLDAFARGSVFRQEQRPDELNTKDERRQPHISREWTVHDPGRKEQP